MNVNYTVQRAKTKLAKLEKNKISKNKNTVQVT